MQGGLYSLGPRQLSERASGGDRSVAWGQVYPPPDVHSAHGKPTPDDGGGDRSVSWGQVYPRADVHSAQGKPTPDDGGDDFREEYDPTSPEIPGVMRFSGSRDQNVYLIVNDGGKKAGPGGGGEYAAVSGAGEARGPCVSDRVKEMEDNFAGLVRCRIEDRNRIDGLQAALTEMSQMLADLKRSQFGGEQGVWDMNALCQRIHAIEQQQAKIRENQENLYKNQEDVLRRITDWMQGKGRC